MVILAMSLTSLAVLPVQAKIPDEVFVATYIMYGHHLFEMDGRQVFDSSWVKGSLVVTYHFYARYYRISYSYSYSYYEDNPSWPTQKIIYGHDDKQATLYRDGNGVTLEVSRTYEYYPGGILYATDHIYLYIHFDESSGEFSAWGKNVMETAMIYFDWPIQLIYGG